MKKIIALLLALVCFSALAEQVTFAGTLKGKFGSKHLRVEGETQKTSMKEISSGVVAGADLNALGIASGDQVEVTLEANGSREHNGKTGWKFVEIIRIKKL